MENKQTEKSQAELYREERKKRMAKAAKKNSKRNPQLAKAGHIAGKVISIIIVIALCLGVLYGCLNFFGVPQKVLRATTISGKKVSVAKYNFYYTTTYLNTYQQSANYDAQNGAGTGLMYTGYDSTKSPMDQEYVGELEGYENPTWADAFKETALTYIRTYVSYAELARKDGIKITDEQKKSIDDQISSWKETADSNDYSLNAFFYKQYGAGVNEKLVREILEEQFLAENYAQKKQESIQDSITSKQIKEELAKNPKNYTTFDVSAFAVKADVEKLSDDASESEINAAQKKAKDAAKKKAESLLASVTNDKTALEAAKTIDKNASESTVNLKGTSAGSVTTSFGDKVTNWIFESNRKAGDKAVIENDSGYVVVYLSSVPATDDVKGVDVRHILVAFPTDDSGNTKTLSEEEKSEYYKKAKSILDEYRKTPTVEKFTELSTKNNEDPGSKDNGGLYENVYPGTMVEEFNDWIFDSARKPGDTDIVETDYGYHVMLFVDNNNLTSSENDAKTALTNKALEDFDTEVTGGSDKRVDRSEFAVNWTCKKLEKTIKTQYIKTGTSN